MAMTPYGNQLSQAPSFPALQPHHARSQQCLAFVSKCKRQKICSGAAVKDSTAVIERASQDNARHHIEIPKDLQNSVVRLKAPNAQAAGGETDVFVLGMSHVSQESVDAVRSIIQAVRPEVVVVELCRDRVGLMLNPDGPMGVQLWNSRQLSISGLPKADSWPTEREVLSVVTTRPGKAFSVPDVEADCVRLLKTGLFQSVRPSFKRPVGSDAPHFVRVLGGRLATVPPLGPVEFVAVPRVLPAPTDFTVRIDSSLASAGITLPQEEIEQIKQTLLKESSNPNSQQNDQKPAVNENDSAEATTSESESEKKPEKKDRILGLDALLQARKNLLSVVSQQLSTPFDVSLNGIESGDIEAVLKARWPHDQEFRSGLEASASGGEGFGIQAFKPQRGPLKISANLKIPNLAKVLQRMGEHAEDFVQPVSGQEEQNQWRAWDASEIKAAEEAGDEDDEDRSLSLKAATLLSQLYAKFQAKAGDTVGVRPGAAWREALEAASENGGKQVLLGDMPADKASKNLADGIWRGLSLRVQAAAIVTAGAATAAVGHLLPSGTEGYAGAAVAALVGLAAIPFLIPLLEVYLFSQRSAAEIEDTVRIKESLQARGTEMLRLSGEDAIISWPNAKETIIDARDQYMARTIHAAATGSSASPGFILDTSEERHAWQYAMPSNAPAGVSQPGNGLGEFTPAKAPSAVVAVVGSAHVGGIVREWQAAQDASRLSELLGADSQ